MKQQLDDIVLRSSKFTGRQLRWVIDAGCFRLEDDTTLGNLQLVLLPGGTLHERYMRVRHFGLGPMDVACIKQALHAAGDVKLPVCAACTTCGLPRPKTFRNEPGECMFSHMRAHSPPLNEGCACSRESCGRAECAEAVRR
jgi:hypothetical protein